MGRGGNIVQPRVRKGRCLICGVGFESSGAGRPRQICGSRECLAYRRQQQYRPARRCVCQWCGNNHTRSSPGRGAPAPAASPEAMPAAPVLDFEGEGV